MKSIALAWIAYHRRTEQLAQNLGAQVFFIRRGRRGNPLTAPLRYLRQAVDTWRVLRQQRPDLILVQNPPIFLTLEVFLYARRHGARYIIDSHTGAFIAPRWRWSLPLHRFLSRHAITTIVTNEPLQRLVNRWGAHAFILGFMSEEYRAGAAFPLHGAFNVAVVCAFDYDEPVGVIFEAAQRLPDVNFYVTGDATRAPAQLVAHKPDNLCLTGYLPEGQYISLLSNADMVMDLTLRDNTLLMGAFEAVSLGTPLIVSDWPALRSYFNKGTVHVPNTVEGVCIGIRQAQHEIAALRHGVLALRQSLEDESDRKVAELGGLIAASQGGG